MFYFCLFYQSLDFHPFDSKTWITFLSLFWELRVWDQYVKKKKFEMEINLFNWIIFIVCTTIDGHTLHNGPSPWISVDPQHIIVNIIILQSNWFDMGQSGWNCGTRRCPRQLNFTRWIGFCVYYIQARNHFLKTCEMYHVLLFLWVSKLNKGLLHKYIRETIERRNVKTFLISLAVV